MSAYILLMSLKNIAILAMGFLVGFSAAVLMFKKVQATGKVLVAGLIAIVGLLAVLFSINISLPF